MPSPIFGFGRFELDVRGYELRRAGRKIPLQRVPMDLLILLVERKGALVTREEIASRVWNGDGLADTQSSINTAIRKIRQALDDKGAKPRFIETVTGKGYRFAGEISMRTPPSEPATNESPAPQPPVRTTREKQRLLLIAAAVGALAASLVLIVSGLSSRKAESITIVPFTALPGLHAWPSFSPNGDLVAFAWTGESGGCSHIFIKPVGSGSAAQITDGHECDTSPSWSRDGRWLAFLRTRTDGDMALHVVPGSGGQSRAITNFAGPNNYRPAWTPDGQALLVMATETPGSPPGLFRVALKTGAMRRITTPEPGSTGDWCPAYSPHGNVLAWLHNAGSRRLSPLYVVPVDSNGAPSANARRIETGSAGFTDIAWSADGESLIGATSSGLVRVPLSGGAVQPLPFPDGSQPAIAPRGKRLVYVRPSRDTDIFRVPAPGRPGVVKKLISSTREEFAPQYSADGKRIAFVSDRTGSAEIWIANADGENARQITSFGSTRGNAASVGSPRWSPDGQWIAFDSTLGPHPGIYLVASAGGEPRRISSGQISGVRPSWSRDGKWIYFGSNPRGDWNIWKISPQSGALVQVTRNGGREAFEAPGGEFLYYTKTPPVIGIWRMFVRAGAEVKFSDAGSQGRWAIGGRGIYYLNEPDDLEFEDFLHTSRIRIQTPGLQLGQRVANMIAAAPDDCCILLSVLVRAEDQLILAQNFQ